MLHSLNLCILQFDIKRAIMTPVNLLMNEKTPNTPIKDNNLMRQKVIFKSGQFQYILFHHNRFDMFIAEQ